MKRNSGFTLLELMVGVAVAAILLAVGIPSFTSSVKQNQAASDANALLTALTLTRSEAITRATNVTLCVSSDGSTCDSASGASWSEGYRLYYTPPSGTAVTLKTEVPLSKASSISAGSSFAKAVSFNGIGGAGSVDGSSGAFTPATDTFTVLPNNLPASLNSYARCVSVYRAGRIYIKKPDPTTLACS